ncbi:MBL fold metallo-hydrolase [Aureimonas phyllosphaerae]|uniref:MBL fold metallo-hydrolase n=1 Tax=Aureimonas phyllosphaerae TaxID=1166078 RepID=UPI003A5BC66C
MARFTRFTVGDVEVFVLSAGPLPIGTPDAVFAPLPGPWEHLDGLEPGEQVVVPQNVLALRRGNQIALLDTGSSDDDVPGSPLELALNEAGLRRDAVDTILLSHAHRDHVGGILCSDGSLRFPSAKIHLHSADLDFWLSDERMGTPRERSAREAQRTLGPHRDRIRTFEDGQEPFPGVVVIHTRGHTPGHSSFMVSSGGQSLFVAGDIIHHRCQFDFPDIGMRFDVEMEEGTRMRQRLLDHLATASTPAYFYHLPATHPVRVERLGSGSGFVPVEYR